jgi:hypothetical protein
MPPKDKSATKAAVEPTDEKVTISIKDENGRQYRLSSDELGPADDLVCRQQLGFPAAHFLEHFSGDSLLVVMWLARRKTGEPNLPFQKVLSKYSTYQALNSLEVEVEGLDEADEAPLAEEDS